MTQLLQRIRNAARWRRLLVVALLAWGWVVFVLLMVIEAYGHTDHAQPADIIIVLGAGLREDNTAGPALTRRAAHAADLWKAGYAPVVVCSGGKPGTRTRSEADACAELLRGDGVPQEAILLEDHSRSTEENAMETHAIMNAQGWHTAIIVSDAYHVFRAHRLFHNEGIVTFTSPVPFDPPPIEYIVFLGREVLAFHWQLLKEALNLPVTYVQSI